VWLEDSTPRLQSVLKIQITNMYYLPNRTVVKRFRFAAFLVLVKWLLITTAFPMFVYALQVERREMSYLAIGLMALAGLVCISHWLVGARARCPMCLVPSFSHKKMAKSAKAGHFMGSYRFFVALGVIFRGCFHCPYCAENVAVQIHRRLPPLRRGL
jgi:hypothetical protein